jgi:hypothetical protein
MTEPTFSPDQQLRQWKQVRSGLKFVWLGLLCQVGSFLITVIALAAQLSGQSWATSASREASVALPFLITGVSTVGALLLILGRCLCCSCPKETGAKSVIRVSTAATLAAMGFGGAATYLGLMMSLGEETDKGALLSTLSVLYLIVLLGGEFNFLRYLLRIGDAMNSEVIRRRVASFGRGIVLIVVPPWRV